MYVLPTLVRPYVCSHTCPHTSMLHMYISHALPPVRAARPHARTSVRPSARCAHASRICSHVPGMDLPSFDCPFPTPPRVGSHRGRKVLPHQPLIPKRFGRRAGCVELPAGWQRRCCRQDCVAAFTDKAQLRVVLQWRRCWLHLSSSQRRCTLLNYARDRLAEAGFARGCDSTASLGSVGSVGSVKHSFLGRVVCGRLWRRLTGVSGCLQRSAFQWARAGAVRPPVHVRSAPSVVMDAMFGAIWLIVEHVRNRMPLKRADLDGVFLPFSHKVQLFRMLQESPWALWVQGVRDAPGMLQGGLWGVQWGCAVIRSGTCTAWRRGNRCYLVRRMLRPFIASCGVLSSGSSAGTESWTLDDAPSAQCTSISAWRRPRLTGKSGNSLLRLTSGDSSRRNGSTGKTECMRPSTQIANCMLRLTLAPRMTLSCRTSRRTECGRDPTRR